MRYPLLTLIFTCVQAAAAMTAPALGAPRQSIALHGTPALAEGFPHFPYVNPDAPKGGRATLGVLGSFDSLNPLIIKGVPVAGVREFAIESLMARGLDEPFTLYGLLAETIDLADDGKSVTFALNPKAQFSDAAAVTADDVIFSFEILKTRGRPNHRTYFAKVTRAEKLSNSAVRFTFQDAADRELPLILGLMPVLARHTLTADSFDSTALKPLIGSGPYTVKTVDPGRSITYARNPNYWGRDLAVNRGRFNFDEIRFDYYREGSVMMDAFRAGAIDLRLEEDPGRWADGYDFPAAKDGRALKREFDIGYPAGMTALAFNTRRDIFKSSLVRQALIQLFDAEWINKSLFNGLYKRDDSYFARSYLSSAGKPADPREAELLAPFKDAVRPAILDGTYRFPASDGSGQNRANQKRALELLAQAGYLLKGGALADKVSGKRLDFEILANNSAQEALLLSYARSLEPLGIRARVRVVDGAQYQGRLSSYDYDMIQTSWPSSLSPGNEQLFRWSQASARTPGTFNFAGVSNPAADAMIDAMLAAKTEEEFISAVRALDRVLLSGDYVVPLFYMPKQWVGYWNRLKHPGKTPLFGYVLDAWWAEEPK